MLMSRFIWLSQRCVVKFIFAIFCLLSSCALHQPEVDKIFSNAQVQYQTRGEKTLANRRGIEMPSYFIDLEFDPKQTKLNKVQLAKIDAVFKKLIYPEDYKLYVSFGAAGDDDTIDNIRPILKRAEEIKKKFNGKVKDVQISYLKNQKSNGAYLRLLA